MHAEFRDRPDRTLSSSTSDQPAGSVLLLIHGRGADLLLSGKIDVSVEEDLSRAAALIIAHSRCEQLVEVLVDLSDVTFADTTLLGVLHAVHRSVAPEAVLMLNNPSPLIASMLTALDSRSDLG